MTRYSLKEQLPIVSQVATFLHQACLALLLLKVWIFVVERMLVTPSA